MATSTALTNSSHGNVTIALFNHPGGAALGGGPLTVAAIDGVANFRRVH